MGRKVGVRIMRVAVGRALRLERARRRAGAGAFRGVVMPRLDRGISCECEVARSSRAMTTGGDHRASGTGHRATLAATGAVATLGGGVRRAAGSARVPALRGAGGAFLPPLFDSILGLAAWLGARWEAQVLGFLFVSARLFVWGMLSMRGSREDVAKWLERDTIGGRYRGALEWVLDRLDGWLTPQAVLDEVGEAGCPGLRLQARRAWTVRLYDRCLLIAVVYPILILLALWTVTGDEGRIGDLVVLEGDLPGLLRVAILCGVVLSIILALLTALGEVWKTAFLSFAVAAAAAVAAGVSVSLAGVAAFSAALALVFALAATAITTLPIAAGGAAAAAFAVAVAAAFAGAAQINAIAGFVTVTVFAGAGAVEAALARGWWPGLAYAGLTVVLALELAGVVWWVGGVDERSLAPLVFLAVLPLVNAIFDFASIGLTRWALRRGLDHPGPRMWLWAAGDLVAAVLLFLGLKASAVLAVCALNAAAGGGPADGVLDLVALFADIRGNPDDYWWLYLGFLTTLIPTLLHAGVASFALLAALGPGLRKKWARRLRDDTIFHKDDGHWLWQQPVKFGAAAWLALAVSLPVWLLGWGLLALEAWGADLGAGLLWSAEGVARLAGALP